MQSDCGTSSRLPATRVPGSPAACTRRGEPIFTHVDLEVYRRRLAAVPDSLSALISLLLLGDPVPAGEQAELLVAAGLAEERGGSLHGLVRVVPHDDLLIASDRLDVDGADRVAGVHRPSAVLAHLTIREPVERASTPARGTGSRRSCSPAMRSTSSRRT